MASVTTFAITESARLELLDLLRNRANSDFVVSVRWWDGSWSGKPKPDGGVVGFEGPRWGVGCYERSKISVAEIVTISGIDFCFDQGTNPEGLNGKTLDYRDGDFHVD